MKHRTQLEPQPRPLDREQVRRLLEQYRDGTRLNVATEIAGLAGCEDLHAMLAYRLPRWLDGKDDIEVLTDRVMATCEDARQRNRRS